MLYAWGRGKDGRTGHGDEADRASPEPVAALRAERLVSVAMGNCHGAAVSARGAIWTWGAGGFGELGHGDDRDSRVPRRLESRLRFSHVACGFYHTAAIAEGGSVWTWGWGRDGQLGHSDDTGGRPGRVTGLQAHQACSVACGHSFTMALSTNGAVFVWGLVEGRSPFTCLRSSVSTDDGEARLKQLRLPLPAWQIAGGGRHAAALLRNKTLWTWGSNTHGQLGHGSASTVREPGHVASLVDVTSVSCGEDHSTAVGRRFGPPSRTDIHGDALSDAVAIWIWGRCEYTGSEARDRGNVLPRLPPWTGTVGPPSDSPTALSCGYYHSACILASGQLVIWSAHEAAGAPRTIAASSDHSHPFIAVACGGFATVGLVDSRAGGKLSLGPQKEQQQECKYACVTSSSSRHGSSSASGQPPMGSLTSHANFTSPLVESFDREIPAATGRASHHHQLATRLDPNSKGGMNARRTKAVRSPPSAPVAAPRHQFSTSPTNVVQEAWIPSECRRCESSCSPQRCSPNLGQGSRCSSPSLDVSHELYSGRISSSQPFDTSPFAQDTRGSCCTSPARCSRKEQARMPASQGSNAANIALANRTLDVLADFLAEQKWTVAELFRRAAVLRTRGSPAQLETDASRGSDHPHAVSPREVSVDGSIDAIDLAALFSSPALNLPLGWDEATAVVTTLDTSASGAIGIEEISGAIRRRRRQRQDARGAARDPCISDSANHLPRPASAPALHGHSVVPLLPQRRWPEQFTETATESTGSSYVAAPTHDCLPWTPPPCTTLADAVAEESTVVVVCDRDARSGSESLQAALSTTSRPPLARTCGELIPRSPPPLPAFVAMARTTERPSASPRSPQNPRTPPPDAANMRPLLHLSQEASRPPGGGKAAHGSALGPANHTIPSAAQPGTSQAVAERMQQEIHSLRAELAEMRRQRRLDGAREERKIKEARLAGKAEVTEAIRRRDEIGRRRASSCCHSAPSSFGAAEVRTSVSLRVLQAARRFALRRVFTCRSRPLRLYLSRWRSFAFSFPTGAAGAAAAKRTLRGRNSLRSSSSVRASSESGSKRPGVSVMQGVVDGMATNANDVVLDKRLQAARASSLPRFPDTLSRANAVASLAEERLHASRVKHLASKLRIMVTQRALRWSIGARWRAFSLWMLLVLAETSIDLRRNALILARQRDRQKEEADRLRTQLQRMEREVVEISPPNDNSADHFGRAPGHEDGATGTEDEGDFSAYQHNSTVRARSRRPAHSPMNTSDTDESGHRSPRPFKSEQSPKYTTTNASSRPSSLLVQRGFNGDDEIRVATAAPRARRQSPRRVRNLQLPLSDGASAMRTGKPDRLNAPDGHTLDIPRKHKSPPRSVAPCAATSRMASSPQSLTSPSEESVRESAQDLREAWESTEDARLLWRYKLLEREIQRRQGSPMA